MLLGLLASPGESLKVGVIVKATRNNTTWFRKVNRNSFAISYLGSGSTDVCVLCQESSPPGKKKGPIDWVECTECLQWYHL